MPSSLLHANHPGVDVHAAALANVPAGETYWMESDGRMFRCSLAQRTLDAAVSKYPDLTPVTELEAARTAAIQRIATRKASAEAAGFAVGGHARKLPLDRESAARMQVALSRALADPTAAHVTLTAQDGMPIRVSKADAGALTAAYTAAFQAIEDQWVADAAALDAASTAEQLDLVAT